MGPVSRGGGPHVGPSPRARGSLHQLSQRAWPVRSIPACAGLSRVGTRPRPRSPVHPRVRGALGRFVDPGEPHVGPSPRARGSRRCSSGLGVGMRSIPACAGLSSCSVPQDGTVAVHPRVRGALKTLPPSNPKAIGPSPRARGSPFLLVLLGSTFRSIPACAGLSPTLVRSMAPSPVHPRVRGALCSTWRYGEDYDGPSPRARGSPGTLQGASLASRSIPACAGLSGSYCWSAPLTPVHPRVRGALPLYLWERQCAVGPSPRARGSQPMTCEDPERYLLATSFEGTLEKLRP